MRLNDDENHSLLTELSQHMAGRQLCLIRDLTYLYSPLPPQKKQPDCMTSINGMLKSQKNNQ
jgi:hypothetical protein